MIGVGDRNWAFSRNGVGCIEIAKSAIFSMNCAISCDTRAHFFARAPHTG